MCALSVFNHNIHIVFLQYAVVGFMCFISSSTAIIAARQLCWPLAIVLLL